MRRPTPRRVEIINKSSVTHGSTSAQVANEKLVYSSPGHLPDDAQRFIVEGFFEGRILKRVRVEAVAQQ